MKITQTTVLISKLASRFLQVFRPKKPTKTDNDQKTRKLGDLGPISQKPHMSTSSKNLMTLVFFFFFFFFSAALLLPNAVILICNMFSVMPMSHHAEPAAVPTQIFSLQSEHFSALVSVYLMARFVLLYVCY